MRKPASLFLLSFLAAGTLAGATTWYVSPLGSDWMDGEKATPFRTIKYAMDQAQNGDTIHLMPGTYREHVRFKPGCSITLEGSRAAVVDASDMKFKPTWSRSKEMPDGTWETPADTEFRTITVNGKWLTMLNYKRVTPEAAAKMPARVYGETVRQEFDDEVINIWDYHVIFRRGIGKYGWTGINRIGMYDPKRKVIYFRDVKNVEPDSLKFTFTRQNEPAIRIQDADQCVIRGITVRNGTTGVEMIRSNGTVVEDCAFLLCEFGVRIKEKCNDCKVRSSYFTLPGCSVTDPWKDEAWDNWMAHKVGGYWDRVAIFVENSGDRHEIHDNTIEDHWGGIQDTFDHAGRPKEVTFNRDLNVHHNRIHIISDDALEPNGSGINGRWHHNRISRSRCGVRLKDIFHGPFFAYNNILWDNKEDFRNYGCPDLRKAFVYVYNNTSTSPAAVTNNGVPKDVGTPNYFYVNNVFLCETWFRGNFAQPDWHGVYNLFFRRGTSPEWESSRALAKSLKKEEHSLWSEEKLPGGDWESLLIPDQYRRRAADPEKFCGRTLPGIDRSKPFYAGAVRPGEQLPAIPRTRAEAADEK